MIEELDLRNRKTLKDILNLQRASYKIEAELVGFEDIPPLKDTEDTLSGCDETFFGYFEDGILAGIISYKVEDCILDIHRVAVHPSFLRRGIAKQMLDFIEKKNTLVNKIIVSTGRDNKPAVELYLRSGFNKTQDIEVDKGFFITCFEKNNDTIHK